MDGGNRPDGYQTGWNTGEQPPLREWQRNTWYGPALNDVNPFDEPEDAPELKELRSENLTNRSGEFWQSTTNGYQFGQKKPDMTNKTPRAKAEPDKKRESKPGQWKKIALGTIITLAAVFAILYWGVFRVREIQVIGNNQIPAGEIIRLSGVREGTPIFSVDLDAVESALERNQYIKFRYIERVLPGTLIICVKEREACCWMTWNGILYTMDKSRMILYETEDLSIVPSTLVKVDGLNIRSGARVGQTLLLESAEQQEVFSTLFLEMKVLGCTEMIEEANLSNLNSILLTTRDGFTISMGDASNIHAKLRSMMLTREELIKRDYTSGVINVQLPETPIYSPEGT